MLKNYFKIAIRNILRNKLISFINILGLSLGMVISILLLLWAQDELMYDRFHKNIDNLYQLSMINEDTSPVSAGRTIPYKLIPVTRTAFSEIKNATRIRSASDIVLSTEDKVFKEDNFIIAEPNFLEMFSFPLISGDPKTALIEPTSIIISASAAEKFFGDEPAVGKTIVVNNNTPFTVTGVVADCPERSSIYFEYIVPFSLLGERADTWSWECQSYIQLHENVSLKDFREKYRTALVDNSPRDVDRDMIYLQRFSRVHLYTPYDRPAGMNMVLIFSAIGIIILIIACVNFVNLSTARSVKRAREVGLRKVVGAQRKQLINQFLFESTLITFIALIVSFFLLELALPEFNDLTGKSIRFDVTNYHILAGLPIMLLFTSMFSGIYPALFLSSYSPIKVLRLYFSSNSMKNFRKILVVFQFTISIALIIVSFVLIRQMNYIQNKDLGLKKDSIIFLPLYKDYGDKYETIREELLKNRDIKYVSRANTNPASVGNINPVTWEGKEDDDRYIFRCLYTDSEYLKMFEIPFVAGGNFIKENAEHPDIEYIVNETAVEVMGLTDPVGKKFSMFGNDGYIVGVVKDFHNTSLNSEIRPQLISQLSWFRGTMFISMEAGNIESTLKYIDETLQELAPGYPFEFTFVDESIENLYRSFIQSRSIMGYFAILAMFISGLGLFGLSSYITEQRAKEVSIRKVFGSSVKEVVALLAGKFVLWVAIAMVFAVPLAWYIAGTFLKRFAYHIELNILDFAIPILLQFLLAFLAVSFFTLKTAASNPVDALKYE
ncbi:ABC transporter permease [Candidatus Cloacimonadota bacterium]